MTSWVRQGKKGWLKDYHPPKERAAKKEEKIDHEEDEKKVEKVEKKSGAEEYAIIYYPLRCPRCQSKNVKCHTTDIPVRYHKCQDCGYNFKSVEEEAPAR